MHLAVRLRARTDFDWQNDYGYGIKGRIAEALRGTQYAQSHERHTPPPYTFSEIQPFTPQVYEGHDKYLLFASPEAECLRLLAEDLQSNPRLNVGPMRFDVRAAAPFDPDVGEAGWMQTVSGINLAINPDDDGPDAYWGSETADGPTQDFEAFRHAFNRCIRGACRSLYAPVPDEGTDVFDGYELGKTFAHPVTVASGQQVTMVRSHWRFRYDAVLDDDHRAQLEAISAAGVGQKTGYGCGMLVPVPTADMTPRDAVLWAAEQSLAENPYTEEVGAAT